jgi:hypothetical protein
MSHTGVSPVLLSDSSEEDGDAEEEVELEEVEEETHGRGGRDTHGQDARATF